MNISSMYVKRGLAHLFSDTFKSTKKIDTLDKKKIQAAALLQPLLISMLVSGFTL